MGRVAGKVAVVTGSTKGIGEAIAVGLASQGAKVVVTGRSRRHGEAVTERILGEGNSAHFVQADLSVRADIDRLFAEAEEQFGPVTVLVNNAAAIDTIEAGSEKPLTRQEPDDWEMVLTVGIKGVMHCTRNAVRQMIRAGGGSIVNISSAAGWLGLAGLPTYSTTKGAMQAFSRQVAIEYGADRIRSNSLVVGFCTSEPTRAIMQHPVMGPALREITAIKRMGEPEDVAHAVVYFASDESEWVTAATLHVDGGFCNKANIPDTSEVLAAMGQFDAVRT